MVHAYRLCVPPASALVDGAYGSVFSEENNEPLDLPPAAEMDYVAEVATPIRPGGGLERRMLSEPGYQLGGFREHRPVGDERLRALAHLHSAASSGRCLQPPAWTRLTVS